MARNYGKNHLDLKTAFIEHNAKLAQVIVGNFAEIQQIWDELDYYEKHKQIKGEHPLLKIEIHKKKISEFSDVELIKFVKNRPSDINKYRKRLQLSKDEKQSRAMKLKIEEWLLELENIRKEIKKRNL